MKYFFAVLVLAILSTCTTSIAQPCDEKILAPDYSCGTNLAALNNSQKNELRVWADVSVTGWITGYIVTEETISIYSKVSKKTGPILDLREPRYTLTDAPQLKATIYSEKITEILGLLPTLKNIDKKSASCRVKDGVGLFIEGVINGENFSFFANNPHMCHTSETELVTRIWDTLRQIESESEL